MTCFRMITGETVKKCCERLGVSYAKAYGWLNKGLSADGASFFEDDMNKEISCCQCGKKIKFGNSYTSRTIHTEVGFGYAECEDCYYFDLMKGE